MFNKKILFVSLSLLSLNAAYAGNQRVIVTPNCLLNHDDTSYKTLSSNSSLSLISTSDQGVNKLIEAKNNHRCGGFIDVTSAWEKLSPKQNAQTFLTHYSKPVKTTLSTKTVNYTIKYPDQVNQLLKQANPENMWTNLTTLTNFKDRHANSDNGLKAAIWMKAQIETLAETYNRSDVSVSLIATNSKYKQPSVLVKVGNSTQPAIVIGAHLDTVSRSPGADDDGSGSVTVLETARTILSSNMTFNKPIYFVWYAAEEEGLIGSQKVVSEFKKQNILVDAVLHFDLTGYAHNNETTMWLMDDYTNKDLVSFLEKLITTYVKQPVKHDRCGYACSDHASWTQAGYAAAIPAESAYEDTNPSIHSPRDTMDKLSLAHMTDYLKLATAFAVEMAEPVTK